MIDDRQQELATLYSLDLLEGDEKLRFEQEIAQNPELRRFVADLKETAAHLADAAPSQPLPAGLKDRILRDAPHRAEVVQFPRNTWVPWSIAAAVALMGALLGQTYFKAKGENERLRAETAKLATGQTEAWARVKQLEGEAVALMRSVREAEDLRKVLAAAESDRGRLQNELLAMRERDLIAQLKIDALASLAPAAPDALAVAVWDPVRKEGVFVSHKLPPKGEEEFYKMWVFDAGKPAPIGGSVIDVDANGAARTSFKADAPIDTATKFAISIETRATVTAATPGGPVILISK